TAEPGVTATLGATRGRGRRGGDGAGQGRGQRDAVRAISPVRTDARAIRDEDARVGLDLGYGQGCAGGPARSVGGAGDVEGRGGAQCQIARDRQCAGALDRGDRVA
ncbi:hypothetical protein RZS08_02945, partial [Arthrospira platensis SPKY1]|nr:hypothetical protein [Arthrospira platensis SPKY1]